MSFLPFSRPNMGEEEIQAVAEVLRSGWITTGPKCAQLEQDFAEKVGAKHAIAVSSATAGMHVTLLALGIGPGDEVITPSMTWVSTVNIITLIGATPVFVDVDKETLMVDADKISAKITDKTKAIIPVHYAGASLDLDPIYQLADQHNLAVVQDAAHSAGTYYQGQHVGHTGTAIFSLHAIKNITSAEGGIVVTDNDELATKVKQLKFHGLGVDAFDRQTQGRAPQAEVLEPGFKYNLADVNAAIALVQLHKLEQINSKREQLALKYRELLSSVPGITPLGLPEGYDFQHAWHLFIVRVESELCGLNRTDFMAALKEKNIGTGLHFRAVHTQKYYREKYPNAADELANSSYNSERICSLPLFPDMEIEDVERVVNAIKSITNQET